MEDEPSGQAWYMIQKQRDIEAAVQTEGAMGREKGIFIQSMALLTDMLNAAFDGGLIEDLPGKVKIAVANHAFNLLWSAWQSTLAGRYDSATNHWRSIDESPDFLAALQINPSLAKEMSAGKVTVETARRTMRSERERLKPGDGKKWLDQQKWRDVHNKFAHITFPSVAGLLPISIKQDGSSILVKPGGGVLYRWNLRAIGLYLAEAALNLTFWVAFAFQDVDEVERLWETSGRELNVASRPMLEECAGEIGIGVSSSHA